MGKAAAAHRHPRSIFTTEGGGGGQMEGSPAGEVLGFRIRNRGSLKDHGGGPAPTFPEFIDFFERWGNKKVLVCKPWH